MSMTHNIGYVSDARGRLLQTFKALPRIDALLQSYLGQVQLVEDQGWLFYTERLVQNGLATGDLLDKLGALVGQPRDAVIDAEYAVLITARIRTNRSKGSHEDLLTIMELLVPGVPITISESGGAVTLQGNAPIVGIAPEVVAFSFLAHAVAAGIRLYFVWTAYPVANTLVFGSITDAVPPTIAQSPDSVHDGILGGGYTAGVLTL